MTTVQQTKDRMPRDEQVNFAAPADFKLALDLEVKRRRTTLKDFCLSAIAEKLGIDAPGQAPPSTLSGHPEVSTQGSQGGPNKKTFPDPESVSTSGPTKKNSSLSRTKQSVTG